jgi:hypothetical protein
VGGTYGPLLGSGRRRFSMPRPVTTGYFRDPEFASAARTRIAGRCPLLEEEYPFGWGEPQPRHISAKTLSSLLEVTSRIPSLTGWVEAARQAPDVLELLREDRDHGGGIAAEWMAAVGEEFEKRGRRLVPAWAQASA